MRLLRQPAASAPGLTLDSARRLIGVSVCELRAASLALLGAAEARERSDSPVFEGLSRRLASLADDLAEAIDQPGAPRHLDEEWLPLVPATQLAIAQVATEIAPSARAWRVGASLDGLLLQADRRALHQILLRVLSAAASTTRAGDWIEIDGECGSDDLTITVTDEGHGRPVPEAKPPSLRDDRSAGIGLGLVRALMQAHGGALAVESVPCVGTRVSLRFPASRLRRLAQAA